MNTEVWLLPAALLAFGAVVQFSHWYGRDWQPPAGSEASNWTLRRNIGLGLGALAVVIAAVASLLLVHNMLARIFIVGQAVLLAASGASDVRKFHLPLPITLAGVVLAIATAVTLKTPLLIVGFGLIWAMALIVLFALATRRAMALGDYIAAVWIALAAPFNGLLAVVAGDVANFIFVRITGQHTDRKAKLAAAGPWLLFAAALIALPPFMVWPSAFKQTPVVAAVNPSTSAIVSMSMTSPAALVEAVEAVGKTNDSERSQPARLQDSTQDVAKMAARVEVMLWLARNAGDATAKVAFEADQAARMSKAKEVATVIAEYERLARQFEADSAFTTILHDLQLALISYDVAAVRAASDRLAQARTALDAELVQLSATVHFTSTTAIADESNPPDLTSEEPVTTDTQN